MSIYRTGTCPSYVVINQLSYPGPHEVGHVSALCPVPTGGSRGGNRSWEYFQLDGFPGDVLGWLRGAPNGRGCNHASLRESYLHLRPCGYRTEGSLQSMPWVVHKLNRCECMFMFILVLCGQRCLSICSLTINSGWYSNQSKVGWYGIGRIPVNRISSCRRCRWFTFLLTDGRSIYITIHSTTAGH